MALDEELLNLLVCPETREKLNLGDEALVKKLNAAISAGTLRDREGKGVETAVDAALLRADGKVAYLVRSDIPNLLSSDGILVESLS